MAALEKFIGRWETSGDELDKELAEQAISELDNIHEELLEGNGIIEQIIEAFDSGNPIRISIALELARRHRGIASKFWKAKK